MKICSKCEKEKELNEFYKELNGRFGVRADCIMCRKKYKKEEYKRNKRYYQERSKKWFKNNRSKRNDYERDKYVSDSNYKLRRILRARFKEAIKNNFKFGSAVRDLGCSIDELWLYFECFFHEDYDSGKQMTKENLGEWEIHHIVPLHEFDLTNREQFLKACHYTNLEPLWPEEHKEKHKILDGYRK